MNTQTGSFNEQKQFAGSLYDDSTGLNYMGARYYNSTQGQFNSVDPVFWAMGDADKVKQLANVDEATLLENPQDLNAYSYGKRNLSLFFAKWESNISLYMVSKKNLLWRWGGCVVKILNSY